jgi:hypothetical protein
LAMGRELNQPNVRDPALSTSVASCDSIYEIYIYIYQRKVRLATCFYQINGP